MKKICLLFLLLPLTASWFGTIQKIENHTVYITGIQSASVSPGKKLYIIKNAELTGELIIKEVYTTHSTARLTGGKALPGDEVRDSLKTSWRWLFSEEKITAIYNTLAALPAEKKEERFFQSLHRILGNTVFKIHFSLQDPAELRTAIIDLYNQILALPAQEQRALLDFFPLVYSHYINKASDPKACDNFLLSYPDSHLAAETAFLRGQYLYHNRDFYGAEHYLGKITGEFPLSEIKNHAEILLADIYIELCDYSRARACLEHLLKDPKSGLFADACITLAHVHAAKKEIGEAEAALRYCLEHRPEEKERVNYEIFRLYLEYENNFEAAQKHAAMFEKSFPQSPFIAKMIFARGVYYYQKKDYASSLSYFEDVIGKYPDSTAVSDSYLYSVNALSLLGQVEKSEKMLLSFLALFRDSGRETAMYLSFLDTIKKQYVLGAASRQESPQSIAEKINVYLDRTLQFYSKNHEIMGKHYELLFYIGFVLLRDEAWAYKKILPRLESRYQDLPYLAEVYFYLMNHYQSQGSSAEALRAACLILQNGKNPDRSRDAVAWLKDRFKNSSTREEQSVILSAVHKAAKNQPGLIKEFDVYAADYIGDAEVMAGIKREQFVYPLHTMIFSRHNEFGDFSVYRDLYCHGYRYDQMFLTVAGENPRLESRIMNFPAEKYSILKIYLKTSESEVLVRGQFEWITWDDETWGENRRLQFVIPQAAGSEIAVILPVKSSFWRENIKRMRINFFDETFRPRRGSFYIDKIMLY
ncbi:MAG: hypothetical protein A2096_05930 [Spirochaetes bacterium GWF1_41_5]|nr:MAG: hypothetical protein A2096_05930 [Spirochaetes bacterium GWF1_41_5]HBE01256.1 hypothetical protein [Spirochaetia bacterium]